MEPILCVKGCGFYGSAENQNMCSKCYSDFLKMEIIQRSITAVDRCSESSSPRSNEISNKSAEVEDLTRILCVKGCGFYGSAENRNMCSKCYTDFLKKEIIQPSITAVDRCSESSSPSSDEISNLSAEVEDLTLKEEKKKKNRCKVCNKNVGLFGFQCRCEGLFCRLHRMPEVHDCDIDYKTTESTNPHLTLIKADKLDHRI